MMSAGDPRLEVLCRNAAFVVEQLGPLSELETFGLDAVSVAWVEGFIERQRARLTAGEKAEGMVAVLGSYLGEAIIAASSGCWDFDDEHGLGIHFPNDDWCYPFSKVAKQFDEGLEAGESILSFYSISIGFVPTGKLRATKQ